MRRPWRNVAIVLFTVCLLLGGLVGDRLLALTDEARDALRVYTELVSLAHQEYGAEVEYEDLVYSSVEGLLRNLDPHTNFLAPRAYDSMRERQQETFYGLGIFVGQRNGRLTIIAPIEGTPASRLGLRAGDVISEIEGEPTDKMSLDQAVTRLKGPKGTTVNVSIVRPGLDEPLRLDITRDEIPQTTVRYAYMVAPGTGFISLSDFSRSTSREMSDALERLRAEGMERLVLDLRFNGGGLLDQAVEVADQFLPKGAQIVETRGRTDDSYQEYRAGGEHADLEMPLVVLVNGGTASAAEILAGAIQDHDLGLIVGTQTWGKGLVQTVYSLSYGAGLALTTAKYYTPAGRLIQRDYTSWFDYQAHNRGDRPEEAEDGREAFRTDLGRTVYGGGGITPDVAVEPAEIASFLQFLHARNAFFRFAVDWASRHPVESRDWEPPAGVFDEFVAWLQEEGLASEEEVAMADLLVDEDDRDYVLRQIHAEVFNSTFGLEERHRVLVQGDRQVKEALAQLDRASEMLLARRAVEGGGPPSAASDSLGAAAALQEEEEGR